jgi:small subunit ribosomal protein S3
MFMKKFFINHAMKGMELEGFIKKYLVEEDYSKIEVERTPLGIKLIIYTDRPGRIIGSGGRKINEMTDMLRTKFKLENPQIDVKSVDNPYLDAKLVARKIVSALQRGYNYKKIGNVMMEKVMKSGAVGIEIIIAGKLGGSKSRTGKFIKGHVIHSGQPAEDLVDSAFEEAMTKPGKIGIKVRIMKEYPSMLSSEFVHEAEKDVKPSQEQEKPAPEPENIKESAKEVVGPEIEK